MSFNSNAFAQFLGNEWINYSQTYYKFPITQQGIYHLDSITLANAGINVNSFDARNLQLFFRGQEIPIYLQGEGDGIFNSTDHIEFYGQPNDGWFDSTLYINGSADQMNPGYSLFSDTSFYFLTWNSSTNNLRYTLETDTTFSAFTPSLYYIYKAHESLIPNYYEGEILSGGLTMPEYTAGEGQCRIYTGAANYTPTWSGPTLNGFQSSIFTGGPNSTLKLHIATCNNPVNLGNDHHHQIDFAGVSVFEDSLDAYTYNVRNFTTNSGVLSGSTEPFRVNFLNDLAGTGSSRNGLGYYELVMPQTFDLSLRTQQLMYLPDESLQTKARLDIINFNAIASPTWIFDLTNNKKVTVVDNAGTLQALVPNDGLLSPKKMFIASDAVILTVPSIRPVSTDPGHYAQFRDFESLTYNSKDYIIITHQSLYTVAQLFELHREPDYDVLRIDVEELYDQFGFGIPKHPNSIRNFLKMTNTSPAWTKKPTHVFMIGKSIKHNFIRQNAALYAQSLLPSIGIAPCDNLFSYDIEGNESLYVAIGRLAAANANHVIDYWNKVSDYEAIQFPAPPQEWMKNVLHFASDGIFEGYLNDYESIIEDTLFGGNVTPFILNGSGSFQPNTVDSIRDFLNVKGVSLVTVFGHSSGSGFAYIVDEPEAMTNVGKYPLYIVNGCLSGDLFQSTQLISERFVLPPERGAIAFMASTSLGFAGPLATITENLYHNLSVDNYYETMGISHQNAVSDNVWGSPPWSVVKINALNFQLHGDPALKFNADSLPDIDLQVGNVSFNPPVVTMELDSFKMKIIVNNLGRTIAQPYFVSVERNFPEPGVPNFTYNFTRDSIYYKDTIEFYLPISYATSFGENIFTIKADLSPISLIPENDDYGNNEIVVKLNIISSDIIPVYPYKYAVIPTNQTPLKASTGDPFALAKNYHFQIDTTDSFNSPFLRDTIINQSGGVVEWNPGVLLSDLFPTDSTAYFWRVGVDSANTGIYYRYKESTFQVITGKYGWGQDHFFQFKDDDYLYINDNRPTRTFDFVPVYKELKITTNPNPPLSGDGGAFNTEYIIDGGVVEESGCAPWPYAAFYVFVIDPITLKPWKSHCPSANPGGNNEPSHSFGNFNDNCGCHGAGNPASPSARAENVFMYNNLSGLQSLFDAVPDGYYIGGYTFYYTNFNNPTVWDPAALSALAGIGADTVQTLVDSAWNRPYIFFTTKGNTGSTVELVGADNISTISYTTQLQNQWSFGTITSEYVGPASSWTSFHWQQHTLEPAEPFNDNSYVHIYGVKADGTEELIDTLDFIPTSTTDIYSLNTLVDAATYPFLKLFMYTEDDSTTTPAQLNHWHVMYEGVPECALNPSINYGYVGDTTYQGQNLLFHTAIENIGDYDMDSLQIRYFIVDENNVTHDYYVKRDSLRVGEFLVDTFSVSTSNFGGINSFYVEANPYTPIWQLEQYHFNNIGSRNMVVSEDKLNPLLDVTFDGIHIMNGDIVSGKPFINIQLKDENTLRLLDDTADFLFYLRYPGSSTATKINFGNPEVTFYPATTTANYAKIEYRPDLTLQDGVYELLLQATDKSGNESGFGDSGVYDYKIKFEVINHSTITNIFNYPNPFSTSTQWVFTLTGSEVPTEFTIRIMTISGVVVREITLNELGPIHVGDNISSYKWNGTDEYGDKLATGVYIYQVITRINGETIDHRTTSADKYFKSNLGKLFILR